MNLYVLSDLHLLDDEQSHMFTDEKLKVFLSIVDQVSDENSKLILNGDIFDLTGMNPPAHGLMEFFVEVLGPDARSSPPLQQALLSRSLDDRMSALQLRFPKFFEALKELADQKKLIFIPGNHDCELGGSEGHELFARFLGVPSAAIQTRSNIQHGKFLIVAHGNEFDISNRTDQGCFNPGLVITTALYRGIVPALAALQLPANVISAIPAVRPEEAIVSGIIHYLGKDRGQRFVIAFIRLLEKNGYFRGLQHLPILLLNHEVPLLSNLVRAFITPERLQRALPTGENLKKMARAGAKIMRRPGQVIVLGHTHELDWLPDYVNLGTWIDHIGGLLPEDLAQADCTLPLFKIRTDQSAELIDARTKKVLWSRPAKLVI